MTAVLDEVPTALRPGVQALGFHVMRNLGMAQTLRELLAKRPPAPYADALLCVALSLAWDESQALYSAHTLVDQAVEAAKRDRQLRMQANFINACLRRFLREQQSLVAQAQNNPLATWNYPAWWIAQLQREYPQSWEEILRAGNTKASMILRVNSRKMAAALYLQELSAINFEASQVGVHGVVLAKACAVTQLPGFREGYVSVQDAAAQRAAPLLLNGLQGAGGQALKILDACAAPGGKTAHLLELADCEVTALDIDAQRCERIKENLVRLNLSAKIVVADAGQPQSWWDGQLFDGILLDAPCTASGIVCRHPDVRWLRRPSDIAQLAQLQKRLLEKLWPLVKVGGRLLYCTCSVFKAEGENQVKAFLAHHTQARLLPSPGHLLPQSRAHVGDILDNQDHEHDGFYYALLEKHAA